ncbi:MAG: hypothetical protein RLZZ04_4004 [Cyanobacteriota bacterium]|jgi:hypothetical protein
MLDWQFFFGVLAGFFSLMGFIPYLISIIRQKTQPNRASWWIWATLGTIIAVSNYSAGARDTMWLLSAYTFCQLAIAVLSIKNGEGGWSTFDQTCMLGAIISIIFWWWTKEPLTAISINIAIDSLGALPTIRKSYSQPETEDLFSWTMFLTASMFNLFALTDWSIVLASYPIYLFSFNFIVVILLALPKLTSWNKNTKKVI